MNIILYKGYQLGKACDYSFYRVLNVAQAKATLRCRHLNGTSSTYRNGYNTKDQVQVCKHPGTCRAPAGIAFAGVEGKHTRRRTHGVVRDVHLTVTGD